MVRKIEVLPYDPQWPELFRREASQLEAILGAEIVAIHHVGSTAIPGMPAKPIVDILVEVACINRIDDFNQVMIDRGYLPKGAFGIHGRRFFIKGDEEQRSHHIHVFEAGNREIDRYLAFRDYMIARPGEAEAYARLKQELALRFAHDIERYMAGKDDFIKEIQGKARMWKKRR